MQSVCTLYGVVVRLNFKYTFQVVSRFPLDRYVLDVVRPRKDRVLLLDFNPWGATTDSLLYNWEELEQWAGQGAEQQFRVVEDGGGVVPHPYHQYSLPRDVVDLAFGTDPFKLIDFLKLKQRAEVGEDCSSEEEEETADT